MSIAARDFQVLLVSGYARRIIKKNVISNVLKTCIMFYNGFGFHVELLPFQFSCNEESVETHCHPSSWSNCDSTTFDVRRGPNYVDGQKKKSKSSLYTIFKIEGYHTPFKMHEIWKYVHPTETWDKDFKITMNNYSIKQSNGQKCPYKLPPLLILNVMVPIYKPEMGKNGKKDGKGWQIVCYCHLSDPVYKKLDKYINSKSSKKLPIAPGIKLFSQFMNSQQLQRERFKVMARIMNGKYTKFGFVAQQLIRKYNAKPFLAKKSTTYYHEQGKYFGIDIDIHQFGYPAKKGLHLVKDYQSQAIYDVGMVIQGETNKELPEQMLISIRLSKLHFNDLCKDLNNDIIKQYKKHTYCNT